MKNPNRMFLNVSFISTEAINIYNQSCSNNYLLIHWEIIFTIKHLWLKMPEKQNQFHLWVFVQQTEKLQNIQFTVTWDGTKRRKLSKLRSWKDFLFEKCSCLKSLERSSVSDINSLDFKLKFSEDFIMKYKVQRLWYVAQQASEAINKLSGVCLTQNYSLETENVMLLLVFGAVSKQTNVTKLFMMKDHVTQCSGETHWRGF